jgi:hypothetical protein
MVATPSEERIMNRRSLGGLIALNVALLVAVLALNFSPAQAQLRLEPGEYTMVAGDYVGRPNQQVVWITDIRSTRVLGVIFSSGDKSLTFVNGRTLNTDLPAR